MPGMPTGTVTFLFTDIEGSTELLQRLGDRRYAEVLTAHQRLLRSAFAHGGGHEIDSQGDAFFIAFQHAHDAVATAVTAQQVITRHEWPEGIAVRVRMGLHTGTPTISTGGGYVGLDVHRAARICAAGHGGQILLSFETSHLIEHDPPSGVRLRDLGSHRLKDLQQPEKVFQALHPELPSEFPPPKSLDTFANNLPRQLTSFIGRDREMAEVKRLLSTTYLLTLTGTGGAGKTRLALQVAADVLEGYLDGVWLVELAALTDPGLVPQTAAAALGVREVPGRPIMDTLLEYLQPKKLLLVVDNCEHLVAACAHLAEIILRTCPGVRILATSQEALGIAGELTWLVPSLSLPDLRNPPPVEHLAQFEAVRLFIERAAAAKPTFTLTPANAVPVTAVVQRLDGIPLAIELAAARVPALSVEQIATRLDDRFRLLTRGSRTTLPRHQTLRAALDWSYQLLTDREQLMLRRLSVFSGGWTLEAAEAVCGDANAETFDVLDLLTQLVFKSLVVTDEQNGVVRYRLLETVRQYAVERLKDSSEADAARGKHHDWFLAQGERAEPELTGPHQGAWLDRLETEHDNLRAALEWCLKTGRSEAATRWAKALGRFWIVRRYIQEGRQRLAGILGLVGPSPTAQRAEALLWAGHLAWRQNDHAAARALLSDSLAIYRRLDDKLGMGRALNILGLVAREQGDYAAARALHEEDLALRRALGDKSGISHALNNLGLVAREQGDYAAARALHEESLGLRREIGDRFSIGQALNNLGLVATAQGEYVLARSFYEESLAIKRELGDRLGIAYGLHNLGDVAYHQSDYASAHALFEESLKIKRELQDRWGIAYTLNKLGHIACARGNPEEAGALYAQSLTMRRELSDRLGIAECLEGLARLARIRGFPSRAALLLAAAESLREALRAPLPLSDRAEHERQVAALRADLGESAFGGMWARGRAMTPEQAVGYALAPDAA